jgi:hypothetical protein
LHRVLSAAVFFVLLGASTRAFAEDADADALIAKGVSLREKGHDDEALRAFRAAYAKAATPRARAQIALAEQALGMWVAAESDLIAALASEKDAWIVKNKGALDGALAIIRKHVGGLEVRGADGADVLVDGARIGTASGGAAFRVEAGTRALEVRAAGFHPTTRTIDVPPGGVARETISLVAIPPSSPAAGAADTGPAGPTGGADHGRGQRLVGWVLVGAGAAGLATGGVALLIRKGIVDDYNANCPGISPNVVQPPACADRVDAQDTWLTVSVVSFIAGGVLALGGIALMATAPSSSPSSSRRASIQCSFGGCFGRF